MKTFTIILLAGSSTRFSGETKKQFFEIKNKPLMLYSLETFDKSKEVDEIVLVVAPTDFDKVQDLISSKGYKKISIHTGDEKYWESKLFYKAKGFVETEPRILEKNI